MASKLCCTTDQDSRTSSPELPNARISEPIPAQQPLLPKVVPSPSSRFTSARSDELDELRHIFENAGDPPDHRSSPKRKQRARVSRTSIISLHSLHKMSSMRSIIRKKFSKDLPAAEDKTSHSDVKYDSDVEGRAVGTVVKQTNDDPKKQLRITKEDLRKDLLSDKQPDEGGYDPDAQVLDDVAKNMGKKFPVKRLSVHSIEWTPSIGSKSTPGSSNMEHSTPEPNRDMQPYLVQKASTLSFGHRISQVFSSPNLRLDTPSERERKLRRSHSETSMRLPEPSPISPLRLPSLRNHDKDGMPWGEVLHRSLRLSDAYVPPRHDSLGLSETLSQPDQSPKETLCVRQGQDIPASAPLQADVGDQTSLCGKHVEIRIQQPTSFASPRPSTSIQGTVRENAIPVKEATEKCPQEHDDDENPRRSVHLYSMRISHHLRSGSLLSWDRLADAPDLPTSSHATRSRAVSDQSRNSVLHHQLIRHTRQTSSSGFASSKVPSRWGKVMPIERDPRNDVASSIYSSRPQSPPDSFGGSMYNLSRTGTTHYAFAHETEARSPRRSNSFPTNNEETPRPLNRYGSIAANATASLARKNSVADTKKSKFREELSPSPPKKVTPSSSIMKFLNPKRLSLRSNSEANLRSRTPPNALDGQHDDLTVPLDKERRQSRSMISLQAEQESMGQNKGANHVWDRALKAHQEEKASMFLSKNKDLAVHASPFRERSGSVSTRRISMDPAMTPGALFAPKRFSAPSIDPNSPGTPALEAYTMAASTSRRRALIEDAETKNELAEAFEKQGDDTEVVGAWGRYPSHTRHERAFSAGKRDRVESRDFALEAAIQFASKKDTNHDEDLVDPNERPKSPPLLPGEKKRKKKVGSARIAKSNSMTFGKNFLKKYSEIFKSQSTEFRRHGRGHRSSIASGGVLEFPELEMLPDVWASRRSEDHGADGQDDQESPGKTPGVKGKNRVVRRGSKAPLHVRRNSSAPDLSELSRLHDGAADPDHLEDSARVWSIYYETCIPSFPRLSTDANPSISSNLSFTNKRASLHSRGHSARWDDHMRNKSQISHISSVSRASARPSFRSVGAEETMGLGGEDKSMVSVRRSTMDLISQFKKQEVLERERVLSLTRAESRREGNLEAEGRSVRAL